MWWNRHIKQEKKDILLEIVEKRLDEGILWQSRTVSEVNNAFFMVNMFVLFMYSMKFEGPECVLSLR